ncbi:hypothetical protein D3C78_1232840 [compost metagenome]
MSAASKAAAPPPSTSTKAMGWACSSVNSLPASPREATTDSVMRSCSSAATWPSCSGVSSGEPPSRPVLSWMRYSVMRSTRWITRPQLRAMSVALEAQGEIVPRRGVTTTARPSLGPA